MKLLFSLAILIVLVVVLVGCASAPPATPPATLKVTVDNYCRLTEPQSWSVSDTTDTITGVRKSERVRVCTCVKPKPDFCRGQ